MVAKIGNLPSRYSFILNPYDDYRASTCPKCGKNMHKRKFPLLIFVKDATSIVLGFTCKYCSKCELIVAQRCDLEEELFLSYEKIDPACIGNEYCVVGTVIRKKWQACIQEPALFQELVDYISDFKEILILKSNPKGYWCKAT